MTYIEKFMEYWDVAERESKMCEKVLKGEKVKCPHCGETLQYSDSEVCCPHKDFKRYITPELLKIKGYELLKVGEVPRLSIVLKSNNEDVEETIELDFIESYNSNEIICKTYTYDARTIVNISEPIKIKIKDVEQISSWRMIK